jgi:hypothetical protein
MARRRFRWTRKSYRRAHHLARLLVNIPSVFNAPPLVQRYHELWQRHPSYDDPLKEGNLRWRLAMFKGDDIPF